jgi:hypothetical protein
MPDVNRIAEAAILIDLLMRKAQQLSLRADAIAKRRVDERKNKQR